MGLFDKMFGREATKVQSVPNIANRFNDLKAKYQPVFAVAEQQGLLFRNLHVQDNKLFMRAAAPSEAAKAAVLAEIGRVNPTGDDIIAEIPVEPPAPVKTVQTYVVKAGDTLSKISKQFYGDANEYMRIFYANRDKLKDPDKIQIGQELAIPAES